MRTLSRWNVLALILVAAMLGGCAAKTSEVVLNRSQIVEALSPRLVVGERLAFDLSHEQQEAFLAEMRGRLPVAAEEFLPEKMKARSQAVVEAILPPYIIISETDELYNALMFNLVLRELKIRFMLAERITPLTEETARAVEANVAMLADGMRDLIVTRLKGIVDEQETRIYLEGLQAGVRVTLRDPVSPSFKVPVSEDQVRAILDKVAEEIEAKRPEFEARIKRAENFPEIQSRPTLVPAMRHSVLVDLGPKPFHELELMTTQPDLVDFEPADFDPSFPFVLEELKKRGEELYENRLRDTSEGKR